MDEILSQVLNIGIFAAVIRIATPLILATIGELYAERSGVLNLGIEGTMLLGAMAGFSAAFFTGSLLIETIFSLDGLGLLTLESIDKRDYPVVFATLFIFSLLGLAVNLISDFVYTLVDPRIDFESREV